MSWEKKINFVFLLARWWKKLVRVFLCILRKHVLIFSFNERSENFLFSHHFWVSLEIALSFFLSQSNSEKETSLKRSECRKWWWKQQKIKILNRWKKREQKKLLSEFLLLFTVKNNGRKLVDFALRKSNFLFILMFTWMYKKFNVFYAYFLEICEVQ